MEKLRYSYYPGCSLEATAKEYDMSVRAVAKLLDLDLEELEDWNCCGASSGHNTSKELSLALSARNLAIAEKAGLDVAVSCAACFLRFKQTNHDLKNNEPLRKEIAEIIGTPYNGDVEVKHLVDVFAREIGLEEIRKKVKKPLKGLKVANYYGCYLVRPPEVTQFDDPENPRLMDDLMSAVGAEPVDWSHKVECCGGSLLLARIDIVIKLVGDIVQAATDAGASVIVAACPLCQANLDTRQPGRRKIPVMYFSELMGIALGVDKKAMNPWWKKHIVSLQGVLKLLDLTS
ncbi:CoB--CoM heterodisulfide reductase iron-sulfur subunit B family protein [Chloroflexota bacterium]